MGYCYAWCPKCGVVRTETVREQPPTSATVKGVQVYYLEKCVKCGEVLERTRVK